MSAPQLEDDNMSRVGAPKGENDEAVVWNLDIQRHVAQSFTRRWAPNADQGREEREKEIVDSSLSEKKAQMNKPLLVIRDGTQGSLSSSKISPNLSGAPAYSVFKPLVTEPRGGQIQNRSMGAKLIPVVVPRLKYELKYPGIQHQISGGRGRGLYTPKPLRLIQDALDSAKESEAYIDSKDERPTAKILVQEQSAPESTNITLAFLNSIKESKRKSSSEEFTESQISEVVEKPEENPYTSFLPSLPKSFSLSKLGSRAEPTHLSLGKRPMRARLNQAYRYSTVKMPSVSPRQVIISDPHSGVISTPSLLPPITDSTETEPTPATFSKSLSAPYLKGSVDKDELHQRPAASQAFKALEHALRERKKQRDSLITEQALEKLNRSSAKLQKAKARRQKVLAPEDNSLGPESLNSVAYTEDERVSLALPTDEKCEVIIGEGPANPATDPETSTVLGQPVEDRLNAIRGEYAEALKVLIELDELERRAIHDDEIDHKHGNPNRRHISGDDSEDYHTDEDEDSDSTDEDEDELRRGRVIGKSDEAELDSLRKQRVSVKEEAEWNYLQSQYSKDGEYTDNVEASPQFNSKKYLREYHKSAREEVARERAHSKLLLQGSFGAQQPEEQTSDTKVFDENDPINRVVSNSHVSRSADTLSRVALDVQAEAYFVYRHLMNLEKRRQRRAQDSHPGFKEKRRLPSNPNQTQLLSLAAITRGIVTLGYPQSTSHPLVVPFVDKPSWFVPSFEEFVEAYCHLKELEDHSSEVVSMQDKAKNENEKRTIKSSSSAISLLNMTASPRYAGLVGVSHLLTNKASQRHLSSTSMLQMSNHTQSASSAEDSGLRLIVRVLNQKRRLTLQKARSEVKQQLVTARSIQADEFSETDSDSDSGLKDTNKTQLRPVEAGTKVINPPRINVVGLTDVQDSDFNSLPKTSQKSRKKEIGSKEGLDVETRGIVLVSPSTRIPDWVPPKLASVLGAVNILQAITSNPNYKVSDSTKNKRKKRQDVQQIHEEKIGKRSIQISSSNGQLIGKSTMTDISQSKLELDGALNEVEQVPTVDQLSFAAKLGSLSGLSWAIDNGGVFRTSDEEYILRMLAAHPLDELWKKMRAKLGEEKSTVDEKPASAEYVTESEQKGQSLRPSNPNVVPIAVPQSFTARLTPSVPHPIATSRRRLRHERLQVERDLGYRPYAIDVEEEDQVLEQVGEILECEPLQVKKEPKEEAPYPESQAQSLEETEVAEGKSNIPQKSQENNISDASEGIGLSVAYTEAGNTMDKETNLREGENNNISSCNSECSIPQEGEAECITEDVSLEHGGDLKAVVDYALLLRVGFRDRQQDELYSASAPELSHSVMEIKKTVEFEEQSTPPTDSLSQMTEMFKTAHDVIFEEDKCGENEGGTNEVMGKTKAERNAARAVINEKFIANRKKILNDALESVRNFVEFQKTKEIIIPTPKEILIDEASELRGVLPECKSKLDGDDENQMIIAKKDDPYHLSADIFDHLTMKFSPPLVAKAAASHLLAPPIEPEKLPVPVLPSSIQQHRLRRVLPPEMSAKKTGIWRAFESVGASDNAKKQVILASPSAANLLPDSNDLRVILQSDDEGDRDSSPDSPSQTKQPVYGTTLLGALSRENEKVMEAKLILRNVISILQVQVSKEITAKFEMSSSTNKSPLVTKDIGNVLISTPLHLSEEDLRGLEESQRENSRVKRIEARRRRRLFQSIASSAAGKREQDDMLRMDEQTVHTYALYEEDASMGLDGDEFEVEDEDEDEDLAFDDSKGHGLRNTNHDYIDAIREIDTLASELLSSNAVLTDLLTDRVAKLNKAIVSKSPQKSKSVSRSGSPERNRPITKTEITDMVEKIRSPKPRKGSMSELDVSQFDNPKLRDLLTPAVLLASTSNPSNITLDKLCKGGPSGLSYYNALQERLEAASSRVGQESNDRGTVQLNLLGPVKQSTNRIALLAARLAFDGLGEISTSMSTSQRAMKYQSVRSLILSAVTRLSSDSSLVEELREVSLILTSVALDLKSFDNMRKQELKQELSKFQHSGSESSTVEQSGDRESSMQDEKIPANKQEALNIISESANDPVPLAHDGNENHSGLGTLKGESDSITNPTTKDVYSAERGNRPGKVLKSANQGIQVQESDSEYDVDDDSDAPTETRRLPLHDHSRLSVLLDQGKMLGILKPQDNDTARIPQSDADREALLELALKLPVSMSLREAQNESDNHGTM